MLVAERDGRLEEIRVPEDLDALDKHTEIHRRLVAERAPGMGLREDLQVATELTGRIEGTMTEEEERFPLELDEREYRVLQTSRRLGPMALAF